MIGLIILVSAVSLIGTKFILCVILIHIFWNRNKKQLLEKIGFLKYLLKKAITKERDLDSGSIEKPKEPHVKMASSKVISKPNLEKEEKLNLEQKPSPKKRLRLNPFLKSVYLKFYNLFWNFHNFLFYGKSNDKVINKKILFIYENERYYLATWATPIGLDWKKYTNSFNKEIINLE